MGTKLYRDDNHSIHVCGDIIKSGGLVAFPTETVYGLGANGLDGAAVSRIFEAKGRPQDNPLILHIANKKDVAKLWSSVPVTAKNLMDAFFPGALTIIYRRSAIIPDEVTAGLDTVAVRMPSNKTAASLIKAAGVPIAAPSANISGRPSPTCAQHVLDDLDGRIDAVIDGGECTLGVESTVISLVDKPTLLRPGAITLSMLESVLGDVFVGDGILTPPDNSQAPLCPGMKHTHYAPAGTAIAFAGTPYDAATKIVREYDVRTANGQKCIILGTRQLVSEYGERDTIILGDRNDASMLCRNLFAALRSVDGYDIILCETLPDEGMGLAYMNRLLRACGFRVR